MQFCDHKNYLVGYEYLIYIFDCPIVYEYFCIACRLEFDYNQSLLSFMQAGTRPKNLMFDASLYKANREVCCI